MDRNAHRKIRRHRSRAPKSGCGQVSKMDECDDPKGRRQRSTSPKPGVQRCPKWTEVRTQKSVHIEVELQNGSWMGAFWGIKHGTSLGMALILYFYVFAEKGCPNCADVRRVWACFWPDPYISLLKKCVRNGLACVASLDMFLIRAFNSFVEKGLRTIAN